MEYKWIVFELQQDTGKTKVYNCFAKENRVLLGRVKWYGPFRKYSFFPEYRCIFETQCLKDISSFLDKLMLEWKVKTQNKATSAK